MIEQFNRILRAHGSNRMELLEVNDGYIQFRIVGWGVFCVWDAGALWEWVDNDYHDTANARWLHAISLGKKRDEEGRVG